VVEEHPDVTDYRDFLATTHNSLGDLLARLGKWADAEAEYQAALRDYQRLADKYAGYRFALVAGHAKLGEARRQQGDLDGAVHEYRAALQTVPKDRAVLFSDLGGGYQYRQPIPDEGALHWRLGTALNEQGRYKEAVAEYREVVRLRPGDARPDNNLAWFLATCPDLKVRDFGQALTHAKKAVELAPSNGRFWNTLGVAQYRNGDRKAAIEALMKSTRLRNGGDSFDFFFLAMAHWQLDEKDKARDWYARAVAWMDKNQPQNEELKRFRAETEQLLGIPKPPPAKDKPATPP
jgi:tetratricopeptide (TPR) repeat protein